MTKRRHNTEPRRRWTESELRLIAAMYPDCHGADVAVWVGRTLSGVYQRAKKLDLVKSPEYLASVTAGRIRRGHETPAIIATRFKKGQAAWNKGLRSVAGVQEACRATQFKKGRPASEARNYRPIGSTRINGDGYLDRKVTDDPTIAPARRWVSVARLVWIAANGEPPPGHVVRFKPGMRTTIEALITPDRLECVSRVDNMLRNSVHTVYPPEVARLAQLRGALNRQINKRIKETEQA